MSVPKVIGRCIYCGRTEGPLSREHVLPFGLGGGVILQKACCDECKKIIHRIEEYCLRTMMGKFRHRVASPSRKHGGNRRPTHLELHLSNFAGLDKKILIPRETYPRILFLPHLRPPKLLFRDSPRGIRPWFYIAADDMKQHRETHGTTPFVVGEYNAITFSRMIAKIAHGLAVHRWGLEYLSRYELFLPDVILNEPSEEKIWLVVGAEPDLAPPSPENIHSIRTMRTQTGNLEFVAVTIRFFADLRSPTFLVVVGRRETKESAI